MSANNRTAQVVYDKLSCFSSDDFQTNFCCRNGRVTYVSERQKIFAFEL